MLIAIPTTIQPMLSQNLATTSTHVLDNLPPDLNTDNAPDAQANLSIPTAPAATVSDVNLAQLLVARKLNPKIQQRCQHMSATR